MCLVLIHEYFLWWLLQIFLHHNSFFVFFSWYPSASILERLLAGFGSLWSQTLNLRWPYHLQSKMTHFCMSLIFSDCLKFCIFFSKMINVGSLANIIGSRLAKLYRRSWSWSHFNILRPFKFSFLKIPEFASYFSDSIKFEFHFEEAL